MKLRKNFLQSIHFDIQNILGAMDDSQLSQYRAAEQLLSSVPLPNEPNAARDSTAGQSESWNDNSSDHDSLRSSLPTSPCSPRSSKRQLFERSKSLLDLPIDLLTEYESLRQQSLLGQIFNRANELHGLVDRVIIIAPHEITLGIGAIQAACCQPYWNELSRASRGSKPKINLLSDKSDNDSIQGVLDMLGAHQDILVTEVPDRWGLMIVESKDHPALVNLFVNAFLPALKRQLAATPELMPRCCVLVGPREGRLESIAKSESLPLDFILQSSNQVEPPREIIFTEAALLPAALLGVNVMELVAGAAAVSLEARNSGNMFPEKVSKLTACNMASYYASPKRFMETAVRKLSSFANSLDSFTDWYDYRLEVAQKSLQTHSQSNLGIPSFAAISGQVPSVQDSLLALTEFTCKLNNDPDDDSLANAGKPLVHQFVTKEYRYDHLFQDETQPGKPSGKKSVKSAKAKLKSFQSNLEDPSSDHTANGSDDVASSGLPSSLQSSITIAESNLSIPLTTALSACHEREIAKQTKQPINAINLPIIDELHTGYLIQWFLLSLNAETELLEMMQSAPIHQCP